MSPVNVARLYIPSSTGAGGGPREVAAVQAAEFNLKDPTLQVDNTPSRQGPRVPESLTPLKILRSPYSNVQVEK
jgi:hypothetical protein